MHNKLIVALLAILPSIVMANWEGLVRKPSVREIDGKEFYEIATPENLAWFAVNVNKGSIDFNAILTDDIVIWDEPVSSETIEWTPIGDASYKTSSQLSDTLGFKGIFDGAGHKVSGIYIPAKKSSENGFFGSLSAGAVVKNLTIENAFIQGKQDGYSASGGLAGIFNGDSIVNCEFHGTVKDSYAGGLVGWGERYYGRISDGHAAVIENSRNYGSVISMKYGGGFVGVAEGVLIKDSENFGEISGTSAGGIFGFIQSDETVIDGVTNHTDVTVTTSYGSAGGIVSGIYRSTPVTIRNTVNEGNVYSGQDSTYGMVAGGFVAENAGRLVIENSVNQGLVTRSSKNTRVGYAAGFIGNNDGIATISGSLNKGFIDGKMSNGGFIGIATNSGSILNSVNEGEIGFDSVVSVSLVNATMNGGFIGSARDYSWTLDGLVNKSNVTGQYAGGLVGYATSPLTIKNSINEGNVSYACDKGTSYLGGLVGYIYKKSKSEHEFSNVVNKGNISYRGKNGGNLGGVVGYLVDSLLTVNGASNYGNIDVSVNSGTSSVILEIGGIVGIGSSSLTFRNNINYGNIRYEENPKGETHSYIGGLIGEFNGTIEKSLNTGAIDARVGNAKSTSLVAGICANGGSLKKTVNEGRIELFGNEQVSNAFASGITYSAFVANSINKGNVIHHWAAKDSEIAAIQSTSSNGGGNYSIADTVMINGIMVPGTRGCNFVDRTKLGLDNVSNDNALTTAEMQTLEFAWRLNTCNGSAAAANSAWTQYGNDYPQLADDLHHPIYKLTFLDSSKILSIKTYTVGSSYTDHSGHIIKMPDAPDPADAGEDDIVFSYWGGKNGKAVLENSIINANDSLYAFFRDSGTETSFVSFVSNGALVENYALNATKISVTLPDAPVSGYKFLGWYDGETLVGTAGVTKTFDSAKLLTAKYESLYYAVHFFDQGTVLQSDSLAYGDMPVFNGKNPSREGLDFVGWTPEISPVTGNASYFASYFDPNASSSSEESSSSVASSSSIASSSSVKSSSSQRTMSSSSHGEDWVVDALNGKGYFNETWSTAGWTLSPTTGSTGNTKLVENDDGAVVLQFWSNSVNTRTYAIQAKRSVYLRKGHSYKIKGNGYLYDEVTSDTVYTGLMQSSQPYDVFYEYVFNLNGSFESAVYDHCENSQYGEFYINGGGRYGGFAIEYVEVEEREIQCPGTVYASQIGFQKDGFKELAVEYGSSEPIKFINESGGVALTVSPGEVSGYAPSGQWLRLVDFSKLTENGTYTVMQGSDTVYKDLVVTSNAYEELLKGVLKFYYYQRASMDLEEEYAGVYARNGGHPDDMVHIHSSTGDEGVVNASKGWYDAGDYGKYTVNSGITTYTLLSLYEHFPKYFKTLKWNIPAEGNLPDLLAEIKYNLDWMLTMQAKDGGVYHKLTGVDFPGTVMPASDASGTRYMIGKSVTAAYDFAAVMAAASRVFKDYDALYAQKCLNAAEDAYRWAESNPGRLYLANPANIKTGAYEDSDASDEKQFAATELYVSTGNPAYKYSGSSGSIPSWQNVYGLATYSKSIYADDFGKGAYTDLLATADRLAQFSSTGLGVTMDYDDFVWGSNSVAANQGVWLLYAYYLTGNAKYHNAAVRALDYIVGKNPLSMSFVTGYGTKTPQNPHHRISQADGIKAPVPGMLVGGPQKNDNSDVGYSGCSTNYVTSYPATSYYDNTCSYATNEVAINWNAPLAYLAGALEALSTGETPTFAKIPAYTGSSSSVASSSSVKSSSSVASSSSAKSSSSVASSSSVKSSSSVASSSSAKSSSSVASSSSAKSSSSSEASSSSAKSSSSEASSSSAKSSSSVASSSSAKSSSSVASSSSVKSSSSVASSSSAKSSSSVASSSSAKSSSSVASSSSAKSSSSVASSSSVKSSSSVASSSSVKSSSSVASSSSVKSSSSVASSSSAKSSSSVASSSSVKSSSSVASSSSAKSSSSVASSSSVKSSSSVASSSSVKSSSSEASSSSAKSSSSVASSSSVKSSSSVASSSSAKSSSSEASSSSAKSSSSEASSSSEISSSSVEESSSSVEASSSSETNAVAMPSLASNIAVQVVPNGLIVSNAKPGTAFALMDLQGRALGRGKITQMSQFIPVSHKGVVLLKIQSEIKVLKIQ